MFKWNKNKKETNTKWYTDDKTNNKNSSSNNWYEECKQIAEKQEQEFLKVKQFCNEKENQKNKEVWKEIDLTNSQTSTGFSNPNYKGQKPSSSKMQ